MGLHGDSEVAQQNGILLVKEHVIWLHVSVDDIVIVCVLERWRDLPGVGKHHVQGELRSTRMQLFERPTSGVIHDKKWRDTFRTKVEHSQNMGVLESRERLCFSEKRLFVLGSDLLQYFDGGIGLQADMLAEVHAAAPTHAELADDAIAPQLARSSSPWC